ncbi:MAG TPA: S41 family peptidase, partial [bacterium]|nr:S41 family peptidase [bacterium]
MRLLKILAAAALLAAGAAAAHFSPRFLHRVQEESLQGLASQGVEIASGLHPFDSGSHSDASDPFQLRILSKVAYYVGEDYVDQARVDPDKMLKATMNALQRGVAEIQVEYLPGDVMKVHVGAQERTFPAKVKDIDDMVERLKQVFAFFKEALPEQPEPQDLEYAAIGGMLSTLDPHSVLLPPDVYAEMKLSTSGEFGGLGIVIAVRDASLTVISLLDDTPASRGGIHGGDKIVRIGEESTVNMNLEEAVKKLRGPKGSAVTIAILRKGWTEPKEFTLVRDVIKIVNVEGQLLSDDVVYVRVKGFQENTGEDVQKQTTIAQTALNIGATYGKPGSESYAALTAALSGKYDALAKMGMQINDAAIDRHARGRFNDMQEEGKREARFSFIQDEIKGQKTGKLKGVVLDLRNNPGGLLDEAIKLSDLYLESGPIVTTVGVGNKLRDEKDAKWPG